MASLLPHQYGEDVVLFDDPFLTTLLARIGSPETGTAAVPGLVRTAYRRLLEEVLAREFPTRAQRAATRMTAQEPAAFVQGEFLCRQTKLVLCAVIRAGILPAQACYEAALDVLPPEHVRIDFLNMSRVVDAQHQVTGVRLDGSKLGGGVDDAVVVIPDPMGATGSSVLKAASYYEALSSGPPAAIITMNLIVTPEFIRNVTAARPTAQIYAFRLDRGLSDPDVLRTVPGTHPERERGLNDHQYIVPGAGGLGEVINNVFV